jgi:hypothetical protein
MGQYESHEIVGEVTVDTNNEDDRALIAEYAEDPTANTAQFLDGVLEEVMFADVDDAHFNTADGDSFIHEYHKQHNTNRGR